MSVPRELVGSGKEDEFWVEGEDGGGWYRRLPWAGRRWSLSGGISLEMQSVERSAPQGWICRRKEGKKRAFISCLNVSRQELFQLFSVSLVYVPLGFAI